MNSLDKDNHMNNTPTGYRELTASVSKHLGTLRSDTPEVMKAFGDLARAATRDGALDKKTKELIALALGVAAHCDACIGFPFRHLSSSAPPRPNSKRRWE